MKLLLGQTKQDNHRKIYTEVHSSFRRDTDTLRCRQINEKKGFKSHKQPQSGVRLSDYCI